MFLTIAHFTKKKKNANLISIIADFRDISHLASSRGIIPILKSNQIEPNQSDCLNRYKTSFARFPKSLQFSIAQWLHSTFGITWMLLRASHEANCF